MNNRSFLAIQSLIEQVRQETTYRPDPLHMLATAIKKFAADGVDPYLLAGVLIEGAVHAVVEHIPTERRREAEHALMRPLMDRLIARGCWPFVTQE